MTGRPKVKRVKHASESQDVKYPSQWLKVPRTVRCGNFQELGHNKISCKNGEVPKPHVPKRKIRKPRKDMGGKPIFDQLPLVMPATPLRHGDAGVHDGAPLVSKFGVQDGAPHVSQSGGLVDTPRKRTNMVPRRGGKAKISRPRNKTLKKAHGKQPLSQGNEDVSLRYDEAFDDLFTHTPKKDHGKQPMSQAKE
ncbi:unnamed protein product [Lactuca virosa]|uniref:Uncharacterized protein n=1 Tax=Lactuca virosa TaxID=75947 RepID=A0AAU9N2V2_9ASTR|nr:unnamed protein product [Lactuca virosa]